MKSWFSNLARTLVLVALLVPALTLPAGAQAKSDEYVIGPDDVLSISVWLHPELERTVTVSAQGNITYPPIGEVKAAGMTAKQLSDRIGDRISTYLRQTTTVTVVVKEFMSHGISVSGAVARPGRFGFETIPGLLDLISQAGGALPNADLSRVQILRKDGASLKSLPADLTQALESGSQAGLPTLQAGDIVVIPSSVIGGAVTADAVGVLGEVQRPGLYPVGTGQDLWMVLAQAGGPNGSGDLSTIRILTRDQKDVARALRVNLKSTLLRGNRTPVIVKPGDIIYMDRRGGGAWAAFLQVLGVTRDVASLVAVIRVLENN